jgi:hypothetical protein
MSKQKTKQPAAIHTVLSMVSTNVKKTKLFHLISRSCPTCKKLPPTGLCTSYVAIPGRYEGSCVNCVYNGSGSKCSFYGPNRGESKTSMLCPLGTKPRIKVKSIRNDSKSKLDNELPAKNSIFFKWSSNLSVSLNYLVLLLETIPVIGLENVPSTSIPAYPLYQCTIEGP